MIIRNEHNGGLEDFLKRFREISETNVYIGVPASKNGMHKGGINMATLVAVHELGATIKHGGGTRYQKNANGKLARFVRNDFVGPTSGVTSGHTIKIPERSFIRSTMNENKKKYADLMEKGIKSALAGAASVKSVYEKIGITIVNDVKTTMVNGSFTPLKASTIKAKGSSKPLLDTEEMRSSITYQVK